jgi:hypothetical protein
VDERLRMDDSIYASVLAAPEGGKRVVLTGPPGAAKTTLAARLMLPSGGRIGAGPRWAPVVLAPVSGSLARAANVPPTARRPEVVP